MYANISKAYAKESRQLKKKRVVTDYEKKFLAEKYVAKKV